MGLAVHSACNACRHCLSAFLFIQQAFIYNSVPGTVLGVGALVVTKIATVSVLMELMTFWCGMGVGVVVRLGRYTLNKETICIKYLDGFTSMIKVKRHGVRESSWRLLSFRGPEKAL